MRSLLVAGIAAVVVALPLHAQSAREVDRAPAFELSIDPFMERDLGPRLEFARSVVRHVTLVVGAETRLHDVPRFSTPFVSGVDAGARYYPFAPNAFEGPFAGIHAGYRRVDPRSLVTPPTAKTYRELGADLGYEARVLPRMRITPALVFDCENPKLSLHDHVWHLRPRIGLGLTF